MVTPGNDATGATGKLCLVSGGHMGHVIPSTCQKKKNGMCSCVSLSWHVRRGVGIPVLQFECLLSMQDLSATLRCIRQFCGTVDARGR